jgi:spermidine/putrescine transport system ATP-binding protein
MIVAFALPAGSSQGTREICLRWSVPDLAPLKDNPQCPRVFTHRKGVATERERLPDVELQDVAKSFGDVRAVDAVSLSVARGEFYSLLGPSGCGKTTTLRLVAGFERPDSGRVLLRGRDITSLPPNRRNVNTVFQHYALFPHLTVAENVGYGLKQQRLPIEDARARLESVLATVRLTELRERYPRELSGGQQQRVALARALVNEPAALLLDEPLAALDLKLRKAMQGELKKLQERVGITFVYVTHDQEEALTLSDRIAVMSEGRILQEDTPQEIYERPRSKFVADFIGQTNFFQGEVEDADGAGTVVRERAGFVLRCAPASWVTRGMRVAVAVRPEKIGPANGSAPSANRLTGTLARITYLGDLVQYHVALPGGREVVCQRQNDPEDPAAGWRVGSAVEVAWEVASALVLEDEEVAQEEDLHLLEEDRPGA